jgi:hypothetical protein
VLKSVAFEGYPMRQRLQRYTIESTVQPRCFCKPRTLVVRLGFERDVWIRRRQLATASEAQCNDVGRYLQCHSRLVPLSLGHDNSALAGSLRTML